MRRCCVWLLCWHCKRNGTLTSGIFRWNLIRSCVRPSGPILISVPWSNVSVSLSCLTWNDLGSRVDPGTHRERRRWWPLRTTQSRENRETSSHLEEKFSGQEELMKLIGILEKGDVLILRSRSKWTLYVVYTRKGMWSKKCGTLKPRTVD